MFDTALIFASLALQLSTWLPTFLRNAGLTFLLGAVLFREQKGVYLLGLPLFAFTALLLVMVNVAPHLARLRRQKLLASPFEEEIGKDQRFSCLSGREKDVLLLLLEGKQQSEVAEMLALKPSTVGTYRQRAMGKLGVASLDELHKKWPGTTRGRQSARRCWLPIVWAGLVGLVLMIWFGGIGVCSLVAVLSAVLCVLASGGREEEWAAFAPAATIIMGLALGMTLRGIGAGFISVLCGLAIVGASIFVAVVLKGLSGLVCAVRFPRGLSAGLPTFILGLCIGPVSPETVCVEFAGVLLNWPMTLMMAVIAAALTMAFETYLLLDEDLSLAGETSEKRSLHLLQSYGLSELESAVLLSIARGEKNVEIAEHLSIAAGTVNSYRLRGYRRLGIHSRRELVTLLRLNDR